MSDPQMIEQLKTHNRRLKRVCGALAAVLLLGVGMAMQAAFDGGQARTASSMIEAAVPVHDSTGFAVFARPDGNLVIVKEDGAVVRTQNQPLSIRF